MLMMNYGDGWVKEVFVNRIGTTDSTGSLPRSHRQKTRNHFREPPMNADERGFLNSGHGTRNRFFTTGNTGQHGERRAKNKEGYQGFHGFFNQKPGTRDKKPETGSFTAEGAGKKKWTRRNRGVYLQTDVFFWRAFLSRTANRLLRAAPFQLLSMRSDFRRPELQRKLFLH